MYKIEDPVITITLFFFLGGGEGLVIFTLKEGIRGKDEKRFFF